MPAEKPKSIIGKFDDDGNPCVDFHLCGVNHPVPGPKFTGIIDTGFTGFLQIPLHEAFALGLPLEGTTAVTLADSSECVLLAARASVTFIGEPLYGVVLLSPGTSDILMGMEFLRAFGKSLMITSGISGRGLVFVMDLDGA